MKKTLIRISLLAGAILLASCGTMEVTSQWKETRALRENYTVVAEKVTGKSSYNQIVLIVIPLAGWGDGSFDTAQSNALQQIKGADDLIDVSMDVFSNNFIFYKRFTIVVNGTAIKYTSNGKPEPLAPVKQ